VIAWLGLLAALVLSAGPGASLYAALPCHAGKPMACCAGDDGGGTSPCRCSLSPVAPSPAVAESTSAVVVLAGSLPLELAVPDPAPAASESPVPHRARAAPLFVLFAAFLN